MELPAEDIDSIWAARYCFAMTSRMKWSIGGMAAILLSGCSSLQITPAPGQSVIYEHGSGVVLSKGKASGVAMQGVGAANGSGRIAFSVLFVNHSNNPVDFGLENIHATNAQGKNIRLFSGPELEREARTNAAIQAVAIGLNAGAQSFNASQPTRTQYTGGYSGTSNYNVYNRFGQPAGSLQGYQSGTVYGSSTSYNPAQQALVSQAIQANAAGQMGGVQARLSNQLAGANAVLARTTVMPGDSVGGLVVIKKSPVSNFEITAAGETHRATFFVK